MLVTMPGMPITCNMCTQAEAVANEITCQSAHHAANSQTSHKQPPALPAPQPLTSKPLLAQYRTCRMSCSATGRGAACMILASMRPSGFMVAFASFLLAGAVTRRRMRRTSVSASFPAAASRGEEREPSCTKNKGEHGRGLRV